MAPRNLLSENIAIFRLNISSYEYLPYTTYHDPLEKYGNYQEALTGIAFAIFRYANRVKHGAKRRYSRLDAGIHTPRMVISSHSGVAGKAKACPCARPRAGHWMPAKKTAGGAGVAVGAFGDKTHSSPSTFPDIP